MLREIINFTRSLSPDTFKLNLQPKEGLHIQIELDESGQFQKQEHQLFRQKDEVTLFLRDCLLRQVSSIWISANKALDSKKKIHSCSPFCVAFKLKTIEEIQERLDAYFSVAFEYCETDHHKKLCDYFKAYCSDSLMALVREDIQVIEKEPGNGRAVKLADNQYIYVYLRNANTEDCQATHRKYLSKRAFNKEELNREVNGITWGVSDYLTGYNTKKPFLQHHTAAFSINSRVTSDDATQLFNFSQLKANRQLPNPLPIFIEKDELNDDVVKIFNKDQERNITYSEIIRAVYDNYRDLGNYYLLNIQGKLVKDFDLVSSFQFKLDQPIRIQGLFTTAGDLANENIDNIFEFERRIVQRIFNNQLVQRSKNKGLRMRYFDDLDYNPKYIRAAMFQLVLKYRKVFYDYIYKSKREGITSGIFHDILQTGIMDDLRQDEFKDRRHTKEFTIKEKLNIWFSLFEYFDQQENEGGDETMANQILKLQKRMQEIANNNDAHVENDHEFAYATGQVIYYLLNQSEAGNKSHALLEPFLQKTDATQLKMAISRTFAQYKHAITFYKGRFEKLMAEVLSYDLDGDLKSLLPITLAGYFSDCVIYQKNRKDNQNVGD